MAYVEVDIEIEDYLDEVSELCLLQELERRTIDGYHERKLLRDIVRKIGLDPESDMPQIETLHDQQKLEWVIDNWNNLEKFMT